MHANTEIFRNIRIKCEALNVYINICLCEFYEKRKHVRNLGKLGAKNYFFILTLPFPPNRMCGGEFMDLNNIAAI